MTSLTEEDIKQRYITPALHQSGWSKNQLLMEYYFTNGQVIVRGKTVKRGQPKKADYLLLRSKDQKPLAIVEAKDASNSVGSGMQQAMEYAQILDIPFAYSSNGNGFLEHDFLTGAERILALDKFPTENELWLRYCKSKGIGSQQEAVISEPYHFDIFTKKRPWYFQRVAVDRTVEAIAKGQKRLLIVMATGTGKTFTAFQIIWRLLKTQTVRRVLYLADRNFLIDQTMQQDFKPFEKIMTKVQGKQLDSSYEIYMSLYQQLAGDENEEPFREFKPEFFDLIVVDECHRGSARAESQWRKILDYFNGAIHIGMTATPKETNEVSNITYFGDPIYTYSLKQGIDDGFLAPYKVIRIGLDRDLEGWRPYKGQRDINGEVIDDREYNLKDYDRNLIIDERTQAVANRVTKWLVANGRFSKTIIFCVDIEHAERLRQAMVNENTDLVSQNPKYTMRITGDNPEGKAQLDYFIDPNEDYPTVVTTSKLMTTGVDAKTVKLIVLDTNINSMTEFKQIIGRGTRLLPDNDKLYFTIMDFREASRLFADPTFDGNPVVIIEAGDGGDDWDPGRDDQNEGEEGQTQDEVETETSAIFIPPEEGILLKKFHVRGVSVHVINERVQCYDADGKLVTESFKDFSKRNILKQFATLDQFLLSWSSAEKKQVILDELSSQGVFLDELRKETDLKGLVLDDFDLILHVAYDKKPLSKQERVNNVLKTGYLYKYSQACQDVLSALLDKYMNEGITELEDTHVLDNAPFDRMGSPWKIADLFGGREEYLEAVSGMKELIYAET